MPFIPIRQIPDYEILTPGAGSVITDDLWNGVQNAMSNHNGRGYLAVSDQAQMNQGQTWPIVGLNSTGTANNGFKLTGLNGIHRDFVIIPGFDRFHLMFECRLNQFISNPAVGGNLRFSVIKGGNEWVIKYITWRDLFTAQFNTDEFEVSGFLPSFMRATNKNEVALFRVMFDSVEGQTQLINTSPAGTWVDTFWNGLSAVYFSLYKDCVSC